jgi:hypothetical protein
MSVGRVFLGLFGVAALAFVVLVIAAVIDIGTSAGGGCGGP